MENIMPMIMEAGPWVTAITALIAGASALTALTPTKTDDRYLGYVLTALNWLALNVYKNKNADAEKSE